MQATWIHFYCKTRPEIQQQIDSLGRTHPLLYFPLSLPLLPWIERAKVQTRLLILDSRNPLLSLSLFFKVSRDPTVLLKKLQRESSPLLMILQSQGDLDIWTCQLFVQLFQDSTTPHRLWIQGEGTLLHFFFQKKWKSLSPLDSEIPSSCWKMLEETSFYPTSALKKRSPEELFWMGWTASLIPDFYWKSPLLAQGLLGLWKLLGEQHGLQETEKKLLQLASLEGRFFSAPLLFRFLKSLGIESFPSQDDLEDFLDETLSFYVQSQGFYAEKFSSYGWNLPWLAPLLYQEVLEHSPEFLTLYLGIVELFLSQGYWTEGLAQVSRSRSRVFSQGLGNSRVYSYFEGKIQQAWIYFGGEETFVWDPEFLAFPWRARYYNACGHLLKTVPSFRLTKPISFSDFFEKAFQIHPSWENQLLRLKPSGEENPTELLEKFLSEKFLSSDFSELPLFYQIQWFLEYFHALRHTQKWDLALKEGKKMLSLLEFIEEPRFFCDLLKEMGQITLELYSFQSAKPYFSEALKSGSRVSYFLNHTTLACFLFDMEYQENAYDKALEYLRAVEIYLFPQSYEAFSIYSRFGYFYQMTANTDQALLYYEKAEESLHFASVEERLEFYSSMGHLYLTQLELEKALLYSQNARYLALTLERPSQEIFILVCIANIHIRFTQYEAAYSAYTRAAQLWNSLSPIEREKQSSILEYPLFGIRKALSRYLPHYF
jgi:hypothetical protein